MATRGSLYCPLEDGAGHSRFARWEPGKEPVLTGNTRLGPKDLFFPQVEDLMRFRVSGKELEILEARVRQEPFVVFGVRPCDCRALEILDRVFLAEPEDSFYRDRRDHGTVTCLACQEPEETCFCGTFGIDPGDPAGDVSAWQWEDALYLRANTEKGAALLAAPPGGGGGVCRGGSTGANQVHSEPASPARAHHRRIWPGGGDAGAVPPAGVGPAVGELPGLRSLHLRLPHLPVL